MAKSYHLVNHIHSFSVISDVYKCVVDEPKPVRLVRHALPYICDFVKEELNKSGVKKATFDLDNLNISQPITA